MSVIGVEEIFLFEKRTWSSKLTILELEQPKLLNLGYTFCRVLKV